MSMAPFHLTFPDIAFKEMRTATVQHMEELPDGSYHFVELYCDDSTCDCRRVVFHVVRADMPKKILATINYGWESTSFYRRWLHGADDEMVRVSKGPTLDPLNVQTAYAPVLLEIFKTIITDKAYVQRLQRHYALVKQAQAQSKASSHQSTLQVKRGKRR